MPSSSGWSCWTSSYHLPRCYAEGVTPIYDQEGEERTSAYDSEDDEWWDANEQWVEQDENPEDQGASGRGA